MVDFTVVLIAIGIMLVSWALTYAWWVKVRVVCLRQHIYDIRDDLFDFAETNDCLDDVAYRAARDVLNRIAAGADLITIHVVFYMMEHGNGEQKLPKTKNKALKAQIDASIEGCVARVWHYLRNETFTGIAVRRMMYLVEIGELVENRASRLLRHWVLSDSPQVIEHYTEYTKKDRLTKGHALPTA